MSLFLQERAAVEKSQVVVPSRHQSSLHDKIKWNLRSIHIFIPFNLESSVFVGRMRDGERIVKKYIKFTQSWWYISLIEKLIAFHLHLCSPDRLPLAVRGGLLLLIIVAVLHTLDRQGEFVSRTDFLWKAKLKVEQEEVETMRGINKVIFRFSLLLLFFSARFSVISFLSSLFNFFFGCACLDSTFTCFTQQHPLSLFLFP